jgi:hypothetical protein
MCPPLVHALTAPLPCQPLELRAASIRDYVHDMFAEGTQVLVVEGVPHFVLRLQLSRDNRITNFVKGLQEQGHTLQVLRLAGTPIVVIAWGITVMPLPGAKVPVAWQTSVAGDDALLFDTGLEVERCKGRRSIEPTVLRSPAPHFGRFWEGVWRADNLDSKFLSCRKGRLESLDLI